MSKLLAADPRLAPLLEAALVEHRHHLLEVLGTSVELTVSRLALQANRGNLAGSLHQGLPTLMVHESERALPHPKQ